MGIKDLIGTWRLASSENFDEYMAAAGVGFMIRKMASVAKPDVIISEDGGEWNITTKATFKTTELKFKLGQEFKEVRGDGKEIQTTVVEDGDKLVQTQKGVPKEGEVSVISRWVEGSDMKTTMVCGAVTSTRVYNRV